MHGQVLHTNEPLWIGGNQPYGEYFDGDIDEVRVYDRALTAPADPSRDVDTDCARAGRRAHDGADRRVRAQHPAAAPSVARRLGPRQQRRDPRSDLDSCVAIRRRDALRRQRRRRPCPGVAITRPEPRHDAVGVDPARASRSRAGGPSFTGRPTRTSWTPAAATSARTRSKAWTMRGRCLPRLRSRGCA